jgi:hypothetical protein
MLNSINEIKKELIQKDRKELLEFCIQLSKYKKDNKEFLSFLLFQKHDLTAYILQVNEQTNGLFENINFSSVYFIKKSVRKILRLVTKYNRFALSPEVEVETLIFFCKCFIQYHIPIQNSVQLKNIYQSQLLKIDKVQSDCI